MLKVQGIGWKKGTKQILADIDLELSRGESLGLVGPNGSGKSSLLKLLSFLETPSSGTLWFQGKEVAGKAGLEIRRRIAVVFQEPMLLNTTVYENVALGLKIRSVGKLQTQERVQAWLERFGVAHLKHQQARSLSGGEAQRVSLARAFVLQPDILFLDEPFSALDAPSKQSLLADLTQVFRETKTTTVIVSHDFNEIERLAQRAIILISGRIKGSGRPDELLRRNLEKEASDFLAPWRHQKISVQ